MARLVDLREMSHITVVDMDTRDLTDLQLPDRADVRIIHDHIVRSKVTEYSEQLVRLPA